MRPSDLLDELLLMNGAEDIRAFYLPPGLYRELEDELDCEGWRLFHCGIPVVRDDKLEEGCIEPIVIPNVLPTWVYQP